MGVRGDFFLRFQHRRPLFKSTELNGVLWSTEAPWQRTWERVEVRMRRQGMAEHLEADRDYPRVRGANFWGFLFKPILTLLIHMR